MKGENMRIGICDDNASERNELSGTLQSLDLAKGSEQFSNGSDLLKAARNSPHFSIVFLDIYMPDESGIKVAKELLKISPETGIVFTTSSSDHAVEAFSLGAVHYLVKPVTAEGIRTAFSRIQKMRLEGRRTLSIKVGRGAKLLYLDEISSIASFGHECIITMTDGREIETYTAFGELHSLLDSSFLLLRRGLLVNMFFIEQMNYDKARLRNGQEILLSRRERTAINASYNDFIFNELSSRRTLEKED